MVSQARAIRQALALLAILAIQSMPFGFLLMEYFRPKGYGILAADNIGAGGTSKPEDPEAFRLALISRDIVDLLDAEGLDKVIGIGHDW